MTQKPNARPRVHDLAEEEDEFNASRSGRSSPARDIFGGHHQEKSNARTSAYPRSESPKFRKPTAADTPADSLDFNDQVFNEKMKKHTDTLDHLLSKRTLFLR
jgi:hypothetical protein